MPRFARSLIIGLLVGGLAGLYLGWFQFPPESRSSNMGDLAQRYRDDYIVMIAAGYAETGDAAGATARLERLGTDDIGLHLRDSTERIIRTSARSIDDIRLLVRLAHAIGQLTPPMQPFFDLNGGGS
jgi:hypothetical protein